MTSENSDNLGRIHTLRARLASAGLDACLIPIANRFLTKWTGDADNHVAAITGVDPKISNGTVAVCANVAALFTDPRYEEMVRTQVDATTFALFTEGTEDPFAWLESQLHSGAVVGFDPWLYSIHDIETMQGKAASKGLKLASFDVADKGAKPMHIAAHDASCAGLNAAEKFQKLLGTLTRAGATKFLMAHGPSIAWLTNLRAPDDCYNPVPRAYAVAHADAHELTLYSDDDYSGATLPDFMRLRPLSECEQITGPLHLDTHATPAWFAHLAHTNLMDPCIAIKARKTATEQSGIRAAHVRDGAALARAFAWIDAAPAGTITEWDISVRLTAERAKANEFRGISFDPIVGMNAHGASIHHATREASAQTIAGNGLLLIDSGGQYIDGTTDVTRTLAIGDVPLDMRLAFTHVLKSHIAMSSAKFPEGATGAQLDGIARAPLWAGGYDYRHGTGHGVGYWLNVHEGPFSLSPKCSDPATPDLLVSIEPGFYRSGAFGIRLENLALILVDESPTNLEKTRLRFDPVTLCPFDRRAILTGVLTQDEVAWLNAYHTRVRSEIAPLLDGAALNWLILNTEKI